MCLLTCTFIRLELDRWFFFFFTHCAIWFLHFISYSHQWIFISDAVRKTVMNSPMGEAMPHALMDRLGRKLFEEAPLEGYASSSATAAGVEEDRWLTEDDILEQMSFGSNQNPLMSGSTLSLPLSTSSTTAATPKSPIGQRPSSEKQQSLTSKASTKALKRPMLTMRSITHVRELEFFLTHVAQYVYYTTYNLAKPDRQFIEALIERDMLGGSSLEE